MPLPKGFDGDFFLRELDKTRDLCGAKVVFYDGATMFVLREGPPISQADLLAVVIRKGGTELLPTSAEIAQARDQRFHAELLNLGFSCGGALLSWVVSLGSSAVAPVTGGLSLIVTSASAVATYVGGLQCLVAIARTGAEVYAPQVTVDVDNWEWYPVAANVLDVIGLAGAAASATGVMKTVLILRKTTGKTMLEVLKGLSRQERKRLTEEILQSKHPELRLSRGKLKDLVKTKTFPKRYATQAINVGIRKQLMEAVSAAAGVTGSAIGGVIAQAAFGQGNEDYLVGVVNAYEVE